MGLNAFIIMSLGGILLLCIGVGYNIMGLTIFSIIMVVLSFPVGILLGRTVDHKTFEQEFGQAPKYDIGTKTLRIYKRTELFRKRGLIKIKSVQNYDIHTTPIKVHVGAATVGGVTTGGIYTTGGQNVIRNIGDSGYYTLKWGGYLPNVKTSDNTEIKTIFITKEMYEQAKDSNIKDYVFERNGNYRIDVIQDSKMSLSEVKFATANLGSIATQNMVHRGYPNHEKCEAILNWICTSNS